MGPQDYLLLGADRLKPVKILEDAYNDRRGLTAEFILNVFRNINRLLKSNFALDKKEVKIQGFMMPLEMGDRQKRFILTSMPPSCAFCMPGGPDQIVEVQAKTPVKYGFEPIIVSGRMTVLKDDPMGLYYRVTDAVLVSQ